MFITGSDAKGPAENDIAGLARNPTWIMLNHRTAVPRTGWYDDLADPAPGCATVDKPSYGPGVIANCDEFPYWSTLQANGATMQTLTPSIRWTRGTENPWQGTALNKFYSANAAGTLPAGCDVYRRSQALIPRNCSNRFSAIRSTNASCAVPDWPLEDTSATIRARWDSARGLSLGR